MTKKIIVIESDTGFRRSLVLALKQAGHIVTVHTTTPPHVGGVSPLDYDLIIIDCKHLTNAFSFITNLKESNANTRIVLLTDLWRTDSATLSLENLSLLAVVCKPISASMVLEQLQCFLATETVKDGSTPASGLSMLKKQYLSRLPEKAQAIRQAIEDLKKDPENQLSFLLALREAHGIRGMAGSYGLPSLGAIMGMIEDELRQTQNAVFTENERKWTKIDDAMRLASSLVEKASGAQGQQTV